MSRLLEHPDDERFYIENVEPLIGHVEQKGQQLVFLFRCPVSGYEITSKLRPGDDAGPSLSPSLSGNPRLAGLLQTALRPGQERREGTDYTVDEIEEAACDAFEAVSKEFYWDGSRWTHWEANDHVLNFLTFGEMLEGLDFEQRLLLRRVLTGVALADGKVEDSEQEMLESLLGPGVTAPGGAEMPTAEELKGLRTKSMAGAVICFGYAIACVDGKIADSEEEYLSQICSAVGLGTLKQWELKRTAQAFIVDEALSRTYGGGSASNEERLEVYKFGKGLGLSIPDLRELEWRFLKRTGLSVDG